MPSELDCIGYEIGNNMLEPIFVAFHASRNARFKIGRDLDPLVLRQNQEWLNRNGEQPLEEKRLEDKLQGAFLDLLNCQHLKIDPRF